MPDDGRPGDPLADWPLEKPAEGPPAESSPARQAAEVLMSQGMDLHDGDQLDEAIEAYKRAVETDPTFVIAHNNLGMVYIHSGRFPEAVAALKRATEIDPAYAEAYNNLGYVHRKMKDDATAAAYYEKFLDLEPEVDDASRIREWVEKTRAKAGQLPSIGAAAPAAPAAAAAGSDPGPDGQTLVADSPPAQVPGGPPDEVASEDPTLIMDSPPAEAPGGPPDRAGSEGPTLVMDSPPGQGPPGVPSAAAPTAAAPPPTPGAVPPITAPPAPIPPPPAVPPIMAPPTSTAAPPAAPPQETPEAVCEKGIAAFEAGDLAGAEELLRSALRMNPALGVARSGLGRVLAKAGRQAEAAEELREAVALDPADDAALYVLGYALKTLGMAHEAADAYERFLDLTPDAPDGPKIRSWVESIRTGPQLTPEELLAKAHVDYQAGRLDEALAACEQSLAADAGNPAANILMGRMLLEKGDPIRATTVLRRVERGTPDDPEIQLYLGQAYTQRNQPEEAAQAFERCLALAADGPLAAQARGWLDATRGPAVAPAGGQCGYCFRSFPDDELTPHRGKLACRQCLASLGADTASRPAAPVVQRSGVDRAMAVEAARAKAERKGARIGRVVATGFLVLVLLVGVLLLILINGWFQGPLRTLGVYAAIRGLRLEGALGTLGVRIPPDAPAPPDGGDPSLGGEDGDGVPEAPAAKLLVVKGPASPVAVPPLGPVSIDLGTEGGTGAASFTLLSGPPGMEIDSASGTVRWRPLAGMEKLDMPFRHKVEVEAVTPAGDRAGFSFEIVVNLGFEEGGIIDTGASPGDSLCLAVGRPDVAKGGAIAVAWGRYREGFVRFLRQDEPGRFSPAEPVPLEGQPSSLVLADVTHDGRQDAVVANWFRSRIHVLHQDEAGGMVAAGTLRAARGVSHLAAGDVDGDGRTDVLATHWVDPVLHVYMQSAEGDAPGRLADPEPATTTRPSGWNRVFVGPLRSGPKQNMVYLLCGSAGEPFFKIFRVRQDRKLDVYDPSRDEALLPERPLEADLLRFRGEAPCIAALVGGETPGLYLLTAKGYDLEVAARAKIGLQPFPVTMAVADLNGDGADDVAVLYPEELRIHISSGSLGGAFHEVAAIEVPHATGPLAAGDVTGDGRPDVLVALDDGKLRVVRAVVEVEP